MGTFLSQSVNQMETSELEKEAKKNKRRTY
jgi:hypothetical protein